MTAHLETLGRWISEVEYDQLPPDTLRAARYQVLNMVAAARAATCSPEATSIAAAIDALAVGDGRSTIAGRARKSGPLDAAQANAAYSMTQDFDDIVWMGHTCHSAVWAALAVAEHEQLDARAFLSAVVVANEIAGRVGASSWLGPLNGQMVSFIHLVGAAAATAKLLRLDAERTTHAMAIALMQPTFVLQPGFMVPTSKLLVASSPTAIGIQAAYLARAGMTGEPRILEDRRGLWSRFSFLPMPFMLGDLGKFWVMQTLTCKTYPGCHYFQTACEALSRIVQRRGRFGVEAVRTIEMDTTQLGIAVTSFAAEYAQAQATIRPVNINFDLRWTAAVLLHAGQLTPDEMDPGWLSRESKLLHEWHARIRVRHDPSLTAKVIGSARSVSMGRHALSELSLRELPQLLRRYSAEYKLKRPSPKEIARFAFALIRRRRSQSASAPLAHLDQVTPLYFPNRVVVRFADGSTESEQVDLPEGSFCAENVEAALETKFVRTLAPALSEIQAHAAFRDGLRLGDGPLHEFVSQAFATTERRREVVR